MRIYPEQLVNKLKQSLLPVYLISGDEPLQKLEAVDAVRQRAREQGYAERYKFVVDKEFSWQEARDACSSLSLFAEQRLVEIDFPGVPDKAAEAELLAFCEDAGPDMLLLVSCAKLDKRKQNAAFYKAMDAKGAIVTVWPIDADKLADWLRQRARLLGFTLDAGAAELLAARSEGNLLAAKQDLNLLALLHPGGTVSESVLEQSVGQHARFTPYQLLEAAMLGQQQRLLRILANLQNEGTAAPILSAMLTKECELMARYALRLEQGEAMPSVLSSKGLWASRKTQVKAALTRLPRARAWQRLLMRCAMLDQLAKGQNAAAQGTGDFWQELATTLGIIAGIRQWRRAG